LRSINNGKNKGGKTMEQEQIMWLVLLVIFVLIEALTVSLVTIWFAVGAVAAFIASMLGANILVQWLVGIGVSAVVLMLVRPMARKQLKRGVEPTNVDSMVGKTCIVKEEIDNLKATGQVVIGDLEWSAKSVDDKVVIPVDSKVVIEKVEGVKVYVRLA